MLPKQNRFERRWRKIKRKLRPIKTVLFLLGVIICSLLLLEFCSFLLLAGWVYFHDGAHDPRVALESYQDQPWAKEYFREFSAASVMEYFPYTGHRRKPGYVGKYVNLDEESRRKTVGNCVDSQGNSLKIFVFGGSTVWGSGARDEGTIPSRLAQALCAAGFPVQVENYGESGYVSTQEVLRLQQELQRGNIPHIVIFYDGFNDAFATYQTRSAGAPQNLEHRFQEFNARKRFHLWGLFPNTLELGERLQYRFLKSGSLPPIDQPLAQAAAQVHAENRKMVQGMAIVYGFQPFFYWQPVLYTKKNLSAEERRLPEGESLAESYHSLTQFALQDPYVKDLTTLFDNQTQTVYVDWSHISEEGNGQVALALAQDLQVYVRSYGLTRKP